MQEIRATKIDLCTTYNILYAEWLRQDKKQTEKDDTSSSSSLSQSDTEEEIFTKTSTKQVSIAKTETIAQSIKKHTIQKEEKKDDKMPCTVEEYINYHTKYNEYLSKEALDFVIRHVSTHAGDINSKKGDGFVTDVHKI